MSAPAPLANPAPPTLRGEILPTTVPTLFHDLGVRCATGCLTLAGPGFRKSVLLRDGRVQFATSTDRDDRFSQVILKAGALRLKNLLRALEISLATRDRLGEVLVRMRFLSAPEVESLVKTQVAGILYGLFDWTAGQWSFEERPAADESIALDLPGDAVVVEGMRHVASWARAYEVVGGLNAEYLSTRRAAEITSRLPLLPGERSLLDLCAAGVTLGEMCESSELGDFQVCRSVWALLVVGALMKS